MEERKSKKYTMLFIVIALIIVWSPIVTPIHEMGHILAAYSVGGEGHFVAFNRAYIKAPRIFNNYITAMGEGFIGIVAMLIYFLSRKSYPMEVMLKTILISLPIEFITLTDHFDNRGAVVWIFGIVVLCWRFSFGPFKNKNN